jgi:hypothetical protein
MRIARDLGSEAHAVGALYFQKRATLEEKDAAYAKAAAAEKVANDAIKAEHQRLSSVPRNPE